MYLGPSDPRDPYLSIVRRPKTSNTDQQLHQSPLNTQRQSTSHLEANSCHSITCPNSITARLSESKVLIWVWATSVLSSLTDEAAIHDWFREVIIHRLLARTESCKTCPNLGTEVSIEVNQPNRSLKIFTIRLKMSNHWSSKVLIGLIKVTLCNSVSMLKKCTISWNNQSLGTCLWLDTSKGRKT